MSTKLTCQLSQGLVALLENPWTPCSTKLTPSLFATRKKATEKAIFGRGAIMLTEVVRLNCSTASDVLGPAKRVDKHAAQTRIFVYGVLPKWGGATQRINGLRASNLQMFGMNWKGIQ